MVKIIATYEYTNTINNKSKTFYTIYESPILTIQDVLHCINSIDTFSKNSFKFKKKGTKPINTTTQSDTVIVINTDKINITDWLNKIYPKKDGNSKKLHDEFVKIIRKFDYIKQHLPQNWLNSIMDNCKNVPKQIIKKFSFCELDKIEIKVLKSNYCGCLFPKYTTVVFKNGEITEKNDGYKNKVLKKLNIKIPDENDLLLTGENII
ncbi:MAG: hypothetical protein PVI75_05680 [Gammaproteobacteria bacterium]|jgi:hypothetical protein